MALSDSLLSKLRRSGLSRRQTDALADAFTEGIPAPAPSGPPAFGSWVGEAAGAISEANGYGSLSTDPTWAPYRPAGGVLKLAPAPANGNVRGIPYGDGSVSSGAADWLQADGTLIVPWGVHLVAASYWHETPADPQPDMSLWRYHPNYGAGAPLWGEAPGVDAKRASEFRIVIGQNRLGVGLSAAAPASGVRAHLLVVQLGAQPT
jgi:hypothetical protein